ncbi:hypothetical protein V6O07_17630 [Arthrospira platensis SPKY2]
MAATLRTDKNGGITPCNSIPELVGKGRCTHVPDENETITMTYNKSERSYIVDITSDKKKMSTKASEAVVSKFIESLSEPENSISDEDKDKIMETITKRKL